MPANRITRQGKQQPTTLRVDATDLTQGPLAYRHRPDGRYPDWVASDGLWPLWTAIHNGHYAQRPVMNSCGAGRVIARAQHWCAMPAACT